MIGKDRDSTEMIARGRKGGVLTCLVPQELWLAQLCLANALN